MAVVRLSNDKAFDATSEMSMLDAARQAGLVLEHSCRTGRCGTCKAKVVEGPTLSLGDDSGLHADERRAGWVLTCTSAAAGDVRLDVEDIGALADIPVTMLPCRVDAIERPAADVVQVRLRFPPNAAFRYLPGQYVDVIGKNGVRRSYSIANIGQGSNRVELDIRQVHHGVMSAYWFEQCSINDLLRLEGPKGSFFLRDVSGLDLVLLATGTGIAPIKALLGDLAGRPAAERPRSVSLYWGGRVEGDLYWEPAVEGVAFDFVPVLSRAPEAWCGERGHVQDVLLRHRTDLSASTVYACGSSSMIDSAREALAAAGLPAKRFHSDAFVSSD